MAENNENDIPTDGSGVFSRDPAESDIVKSLAEKLGISPEKACELCGLKRPDTKSSEDDEDIDDEDDGLDIEDNEYEDDDDLVGGGGLSGHGHRFEVMDEELDLLGASKFGKDKTEATIVFMVDDYEEEDEAVFDIVIKLSNITWNGRYISTYTIDSVDLPDLDKYHKEMIPSSAADIDRLKEDAKRLLPRLKIDKHGELEI